jgi:chemotaxis protein CheD
MEQLINGLLVHGGTKSDFEIKVFGGSSLFQNTNPVGTNNINFIHKYLQNEGMKITSEDVGGNTARKIHYWPTTGKVSRLMITQNEGLFVLKEEESYKSKLAGQNTGGGIELF